MKRVLIFFLFLVGISISSTAQIYIDNQGNVYDQRKPKEKQDIRNKIAEPNTSWFDKSNLEFGGNFGLQFGNYTLINISPQVGYRFSKYFSAGAGIGYTYYKSDYGQYDFKEHFASFNLYGNIYPMDFIIFSVKPEISHMWMTRESTESKGDKISDNKFVPSLVLGGGVRLGGFTIQLKYDIAQNNYSPYGSKIFYSVGYTFSSY